jgi:hypothetical protein
VRQRKYIEPSSLEEELRLSISRCHIYGDDNEELYPLDLIEKVSGMGNLSNSDEDNKKYLNSLIERGGVSSEEFSYIVEQLAFYATVVINEYTTFDLHLTQYQRPT